MLIVGLTPLILLNLVAVMVCLLYPHLVVGSVTVIVSNTIGACADVYLSLLLCYYGVRHSQLIVKDTEDGFELLEETTHK